MIKYKYAKLKGLIKEHLGTQEAYANAIGISLTTLHSRFNGETYFNQTEMEKTVKIFGLQLIDIEVIFFAH